MGSRVAGVVRRWGVAGGVGLLPTSRPTEESGSVGSQVAGRQEGGRRPPADLSGLLNSGGRQEAEPPPEEETQSSVFCALMYTRGKLNSGGGQSPLISRSSNQTSGVPVPETSPFTRSEPKYSALPVVSPKSPSM
jgi:hypothetical protein